MKIYSIYDSAADVFNDPFNQLTNEVALRTFRSLIYDGQSTISNTPGDFSLFCLGDFNSETGVVTGYFKPELIVEAMSILNESGDDAA